MRGVCVQHGDRCVHEAVCVIRMRVDQDRMRVHRDVCASQGQVCSEVSVQGDVCVCTEGCVCSMGTCLCTGVRVHLGDKRVHEVVGIIVVCAQGCVCTIGARVHEVVCIIGTRVHEDRMYVHRDVCAP